MRRLLLPGLLAFAGAAWAAAIPEAWTKASQEFERYIEMRARTLPESELAIRANGGITATDAQPKTHAGIEFYNEGSTVLSMVFRPPGVSLFGSGRSRLFVPGIYAACMDFTTFRGYQHLLPIVWFEVGDSPGSDGNRLQVKTVPPPKSGEGAWPNERLLLFKDFQMFRGAHRDVIDSENQIARPGIVLKVDSRGTIHLEAPDEIDIEALQWRLYHDGILVENGPVGSGREFSPAHGPGAYLAIVGIETSGGFFPVSNYLHFPLFPARKGLEVIPAGFSYETPPRFLDNVPRKGLEYDPDADDDGDGLSNAEEAGPPAPALAPRTPDEQRLTRLWQAWRYELRDLQNSPEKYPWFLAPEF